MFTRLHRGKIAQVIDVKVIYMLKFASMFIYVYITPPTDDHEYIICSLFSNPPLAKNHSTETALGISDHSLVYVYGKLSIDRPSKGHTTVTHRKFKNFNSSNFR